MPSIISDGIEYDEARWAISTTEVVVSIRLYSPYRLLSQMKMTGSFQTAAKLSAS